MGAGPLIAAQGGFGMYSAFQQSKSQMEMANYQAGIYEANERLATLQADDAIRRGEKEAEEMGTQTRQTIGAQRAAIAASGLEVGFGTAGDIEAETAAIGYDNAQKIKNNAWREAWGYKVDALNSANQATMTRKAGANQSRATLLGGGLSALDAGSRFYANSAKGTA